MLCNEMAPEMTRNLNDKSGNGNPQSPSRLKTKHLDRGYSRYTVKLASLHTFGDRFPLEILPFFHLLREVFSDAGRLATKFEKFYFTIKIMAHAK